MDSPKTSKMGGGRDSDRQKRSPTNLTDTDTQNVDMVLEKTLPRAARSGTLSVGRATAL